MGAKNSKPTERTILPSTPVTFSPGLLSAIETSAESDSTRAVDTAIATQSVLTSELEKLQKQTAELLAAARDSSVPPASDNSSLASTEMLAKLASLETKLETRLKSSSGKGVEPDVLVKRQGLAECLIAHKGKPLKCADELQLFKESLAL
ncbi:uncharacterized protein V1510DRAFT_413618 [Dipodascopsis tothii]|uniref:uncharacterized protein n=1 Tax=Dipodascopsis tothii TaxID=44089 RepID=UPI0034CDF759